jgi:hypothetical protein
VVLTSGSRRIGFEIKFSAAPKPARGFWQAKQDLRLDSTYVAAPVRTRYPLAEGVEVFAGAGAAGGDDHAACKFSAVGRIALTGPRACVGRLPGPMP